MARITPTRGYRKVGDIGGLHFHQVSSKTAFMGPSYGRKTVLISRGGPKRCFSFCFVLFFVLFYPTRTTRTTSRTTRTTSRTTSTTRRVVLVILFVVLLVLKVVLVVLEVVLVVLGG